MDKRYSWSLVCVGMGAFLVGNEDIFGLFCHGLDTLDFSAPTHRPIDVFVLESIDSLFFVGFFACFVLEILSIGVNASGSLF